MDIMNGLNESVSSIEPEASEVVRPSSAPLNPVQSGEGRRHDAPSPSRRRPLACPPLPWVRPRPSDAAYSPERTGTQVFTRTPASVTASVILT